MKANRIDWLDSVEDDEPDASDGKGGSLISQLVRALGRTVLAEQVVKHRSVLPGKAADGVRPEAVMFYLDLEEIERSYWADKDRGEDWGDLSEVYYPVVQRWCEGVFEDLVNLWKPVFDAGFGDTYITSITIIPIGRSLGNGRGQDDLTLIGFTDEDEEEPLFPDQWRVRFGSENSVFDLEVERKDGGRYRLGVSEHVEDVGDFEGLAGARNEAEATAGFGAMLRMVAEVTHPGSAKRQLEQMRREASGVEAGVGDGVRWVRVYSARPVRDRKYYQGGGVWKRGLFVSSSEDHVLGLASELGQEKRDVWMLRVPQDSLLKTTDTKQVKYFMLARDVRARDVELIEKG